MATAHVVVAHVLLRSARGERPGIDTPIEAHTLDRLGPSPAAVDAVCRHFRDAGFEVAAPAGPARAKGTVGISGSKALFERHFGVVLDRDAGQAYTVRRAGGAAASGAGRVVDATDIPPDRLPASIQSVVSQIALEAAASIDQPGVDP